MVFWWVTDSYFNNEHIQICYVELMSASYG